MQRWCWSNGGRYRAGRRPGRDAASARASSVGAFLAGNAVTVRSQWRLSGPGAWSCLEVDLSRSDDRVLVRPFSPREQRSRRRTTRNRPTIRALTDRFDDQPTGELLLIADACDDLRIELSHRTGRRGQGFLPGFGGGERAVGHRFPVRGDEPAIASPS
jgi:hypothetical protein